jgi:MFS family permease
VSETGLKERSAWEPLYQPLFRAVWLAAVVSNIGTWMQNLAGVWLMTSLTPSPMMVALMQTATSLPVFIVVLPASALADLLDRRKMLLVAQIWMLVAAAGLAALTLLDATDPWSLLAFTFALGLGAALNMPVWQAVIPGLVPRPQLPAAVSLNGAAQNIARAVGPAVGGAVFAMAGPGAVFLLNALSFVGVVVVLYRWKQTHRPSQLPGEHMMGAIRAGVRYAVHASELRAALIRCAIFIIFASALWALIPLVARYELGMDSKGFGVLLACIGVGALVGTALLPGMRRSMSLDRLIMASSLVFAIATFALGYVKNSTVLYVAMLAGGVAWLVVMASVGVAVQTTSAPWVLARAAGFYVLTFQGGMALASVLWGWLADYAGLTYALLCASALGGIVGIAATICWPVIEGTDLNVTPSMHWPEPNVTTSPDPDEGPVLVMLEYRIDTGKSGEFVQAIHDFSRVRLRDGALRWSLFRDLAEPSRYIETFIVESWAEHMRQHARLTLADRASEERVLSFHNGNEPPLVSHFIYE